MATRHFNKRPFGSHEPKSVGAIFDEMLRSNPRLANACRMFKEALAEEEETEPDRLFKDFFPNTELSVDLKLITRKPGRMHVGEYINCLLTRDAEDHFEAVETASEKKQAVQRNPIVYQGTCINLHRKADGTIYPTFNRPHFTSDFTFTDFCREAAEELLVVAGLLGGEAK